jgi:hypothetical protein
MIKKYSDKNLLNHLKELAVKLGRAPYGWEINEAGKVNHWVYNQRFGSLSKAIKAAGLVPYRERIKAERQRFTEYTDEDLLNYLKELSVKLGRTPYGHEIEKAGKIRLWLYRKRFGSIVNAQKAAGLVPYKERVKIKQQMFSEYSNEYLLNHLKELSVKLGRAPYGHEIDTAGKVKQWAYVKRFGSFSKAQKAAGLVSTKKAEKFKYSEEDVLNFLKELSVKLGRTPKLTEVEAEGKISAVVINKRFRTYYKALKKAGLEPIKRGNGKNLKSPNGHSGS